MTSSSKKNFITAVSEEDDVVIAVGGSAGEHSAPDTTEHDGRPADTKEHLADSEIQTRDDEPDKSPRTNDLAAYVDSLSPEEREEYMQHLRKRAQIEQARMQTTAQDLTKRGPFNKMRVIIAVIAIGMVAAFVLYNIITHG